MKKKNNNMKGLRIILEQSWEDWRDKILKSDKTQKVIDNFGGKEEIFKKCTICSKINDEDKHYPLKTEDGDTLGGEPFDEVYYKKVPDTTLRKFIEELERILALDEILFEVEIDDDEEPWKSMSQEAKDKFLELDSTEEEFLKHVCFILASLLDYVITSTVEQTKALNYYQKICKKFKPKKEKDEEDEDEDEEDAGLKYVFGCFNPDGDNYWCELVGNTCPGELDFEDFKENNKTQIGDIIYTHTGCTYIETITLENTYVVSEPGESIFYGGESYDVVTENRWRLPKMKERIADTEISGSFAPVSNAPGFYSNNFYDSTLREDLDKALMLIINRHCDGYALKNKLIIYEGTEESIPLGEFDILEERGANCIDNFVGLEARESGEILYNRLYNLIMNEENLEEGQEHRIPEKDIEKFNNYIEAYTYDISGSNIIFINADGRLELKKKKVTEGLGKVLIKPHIGLAKVLK